MNSTKQKIDLSIIIPFRDKCELTIACLKSLTKHLAETSFSVEVVLVNNGSTEATLQELSKFKEFPFQVLNLDIPFNFQTLINKGVNLSLGECLLMLNNDIIFTDKSHGFIDIMIMEAKKETIGCVGCLLRYPDGKIQHAGVVIGMNTFADHLYRGWIDIQTQQFPFARPISNREVSAVTGACLMIERRKFDSLNGMNEAFIVCGGDVDLCLRSKLSGLTNIYLGQVEMIHAESQSRNPFDVRPEDLAESTKSYQAFLSTFDGRDPYYPEPLPLEGHAGFLPKYENNSKITRLQKLRQGISKFIYISKNQSFDIALGKATSKLISKFAKTRLTVNNFVLPWAEPMKSHDTFELNPRSRLNVILPHFDSKGVYGGILTAALVGFVFKKKNPQYDLRFIFCDGHGSKEELTKEMINLLGNEVENIDYHVCQGYDRNIQSIPKHKKDVFLATAWWTCYSAAKFQKQDPFLYLIQDYEPCFYAWGDQFARASATYRMNYYPIFNTKILQDFFVEKQILNDEQKINALHFNPAINKPKKSRQPKSATDKRIFLFYGRRSVERNLFAIGIQALDNAIKMGYFNSLSDWKFYSAGEFHEPIKLSKNVTLMSLGKMPLDKYLDFLIEVDLGLSLMLSPHPSYPPLEMSNAGAITVTNTFENKDLSKIMSRIEPCEASVEGVTMGIQRAIQRVCSGESNQPINREDSSEFGDCWEESLTQVALQIGNKISRWDKLNIR